MKKDRRNKAFRPNPFVYWFIKAVLTPYMRFRYRLRVKRHDLPDLKAPFVVMANHAASIDFLIMCYVIQKVPVSVITATVFFYSPFLRVLLNSLGCIPKLQMVSDPLAIRNMFEAVRGGTVLGLFPHGQVCHSGTDLPLPPGTGKLLQRMNLPVVNIEIHGASLAKPKWAYKQRRGRIDVDVKLLLTPEQMKQTPTDELERIVRKAISFDDYQWNRTARVRFKSKAPAEGLERTLYQCPKCKTLYRMRTQGDHIFCEACGNGAVMDEYGQLRPLHPGDFVYSDPVQWTNFEREMVKQELLEKGELVRAATLYKGDYEHPHFDKCGQGTVTLTRDEIRYEGTKFGEPFSYMMTNIQLAGLPVSIQSSYWEFPGAREYYRLIPEEKLSLIHMVLGLEAAHELMGNSE
jgi:1-acyl-sn-glycerol-3-phosphate acyltransferase